MHNSFKYHVQQRRDTVKLELFPMPVYGAGGHTESYTPGRRGLVQQEQNNLSEHNWEEKLKFDVNQAGLELDVTGAFYSTSPSLFPFGSSAQLQLNVALFSHIKWNLPISHFMF